MNSAALGGGGRGAGRYNDEEEDEEEEEEEEEEMAEEEEDEDDEEYEPFARKSSRIKQKRKAEKIQAKEKKKAEAKVRGWAVLIIFDLKALSKIVNSRQFHDLSTSNDAQRLPTTPNDL